MTRNADLLVRFGLALERMTSAATMLESVAPDHLAAFTAGIDEQPIEELAKELQWHHLRGYGDLLSIVTELSILRHVPWSSFSDLTRDIDEASSLNEQERELHEVFGRFYTGRTTNWPAIEAALAWIGRIRIHFAAADPPAALIERAGQASSLVRVDESAIAVAIALLEESMHRLQPFFRDGKVLAGAEPEMLPLSEAADWGAALRNDLTGLERWLFMLQTREEARALGMDPFIEAVRQSNLAADAGPTRSGCNYARSG